jgi:hypothetical protein
MTNTTPTTARYIPQTSYAHQAAKLTALCAAAPVQDAPLRAFHNLQAIKDRDTAQALAHYRADEIIQGTYWEAGKGCDTGCHLHSSDHGAWETELGIPRIIGRLRDRIFEGLTNREARDFVLTVAEIPVGADLSGVYAQFAHWMLTQLAPLNPAVQPVADLYGRQLAGETITRDEWLYAAAYAAAAYAYADADAYAAAAYAYADADADAAAAAAAYAAA